MDFVNKFTGGGNKVEGQNTQGQGSNSSGGGFMDKINSVAGGGRESEKNEDMLDKGLSQCDGGIQSGRRLGTLLTVTRRRRRRLGPGAHFGPGSSG